ncbi:hypothetical protein V2W45_1421513, partial [Cenococcum geophilum]
LPLMLSVYLYVTVSTANYADELETSIVDSSSLVQHHVSRPEQAATSPDALRPSDIGNSRNFESINIGFPETYGLSPVWERGEDWYPELP